MKQRILILLLLIGLISSCMSSPSDWKGSIVLKNRGENGFNRTILDIETPEHENKTIFLHPYYGKHLEPGDTIQ